MFMKVRHKPREEFEIKFYVRECEKIHSYSEFGFKQQKRADFKLIKDCTPRKFFNKKIMEATLRNIAKRDKYFVKRSNWWRPPKVEYEKREYKLCKIRRFTAEQLVPLVKTFEEEGVYLFRSSVPRIVAQFLYGFWFPTPNMESRVDAFTHLFWDLAGAWQLRITELSGKKYEHAIDVWAKMKTAWHRNSKLIDLICAKLSELNNDNIVHLRITNPGKLITF